MIRPVNPVKYRPSLLQFYGMRHGISPISDVRVLIARLGSTRIYFTRTKYLWSEHFCIVKDLSKDKFNQGENII